jgi:hypothetical protein
MALEDGKKFDWIPLYIHRAKASPSWKLPDFQWCWFWKLLIESADSERLGHLPNDISVLWRLAGAMTQGYFEKRGGLEIINRYFERTGDGLWICNPTLLRILTEQSTKLRRNPQKFDVVPLSVSISAFDELGKAVQRLFSFYVRAFNRRSDYTLTKKREEKAVLRLKEVMAKNGGDLGKAEALAHEAITNLSLSEWHQKAGHVDWLEQVFRSEEEFQKRLAMKVQDAKAKSAVDRIFDREDSEVDDGDGEQAVTEPSPANGRRVDRIQNPFGIAVEARRAGKI